MTPAKNFRKGQCCTAQAHTAAANLNTKLFIIFLAFVPGKLMSVMIT